MTIKNLFISVIIAITLLGQSVFAAEEAGGFVDDSLRDMSIVLGTGAAGAILGLSTLSFQDEPSKHLKNIAVGGAVGIVIGVGIVVFSQATRSTSNIASQSVPTSAIGFEKISKQEFSSFKIAQNHFKIPTFEFNLSF